MKEYVNQALGKSKHLNKNKFNEDVYKLMLPIQQHAFGKDPTLITDEIEQHIYHILKQFALLGFKSDDKILKKVTNLLNKVSKSSTSKEYMKRQFSFLHNLCKIRKMDKSSNLLKHLPKYVRIVVSSVFQDIRQEDMNAVIDNLEDVSDDIESIYSPTHCKEYRPGRHRILHSSFLHLYSHLTTKATHPLHPVVRSCLTRLQLVLQQNLPNIGYCSVPLPHPPTDQGEKATCAISLASWTWQSTTGYRPCRYTPPLGRHRQSIFSLHCWQVIG